MIRRWLICFSDSGCRVDEARHFRWSDVEAGPIWIHEGATGTKKRERRQVPIIGPMFNRSRTAACSEFLGQVVV